MSEKEIVNKEGTLKFTRFAPTPAMPFDDYFRVEILHSHPLYEKFRNNKYGGLVKDPDSLCPKSWISSKVTVDEGCKIENSVILSHSYLFRVDTSVTTKKKSYIYDSYLDVSGGGYIVGSVVEGLTVNDEGSNLELGITCSKLGKQISVTPDSNLAGGSSFMIEYSDLNGSMTFNIEGSAWVLNSNLTGSIIMGGMFPRLDNCNVVGPYIIRVEKDGLLENGVRDKFIEYEVE